MKSSISVFNSVKSRASVKMRFVARPMIIALAIIALNPTGLYAQQPTGEQKAVDIQNARAGRVKARGEQVHYTNKFDLSGLQQYHPDQQLTGTIRTWRFNYLTDRY